MMNNTKQQYKKNKIEMKSQFLFEYFKSPGLHQLE